MIRLRAGSSEATLLPHLGGAIGSFSVTGRAVLRPTVADAAHPLESASFPLVPYPNRIAEGRFRFEGVDYALPRNAPEFEHPLHGLGWLKAWSVDRQTADSALLSCAHEADADWPWDWSATQHLGLEDGALRVTLTAVNRSSRPMPCGLGHHPYLVRRRGAVLVFRAEGVWRNDAHDLPAEAIPADAFGDFADGAEPQDGRIIDNCWHGWDGTATLDATVTVSSPEARYLHVFAPPGKDFICLEPTSQMPDAINRPDFAAAGGTILEPGATQSLAMEIRVR